MKTKHKQLSLKEILQLNFLNNKERNTQFVNPYNQLQLLKENE